LPKAQTPPFATFFPSRTLTAQMQITPVLTPDPGVYVEAVTALVTSARKSLHLQFQYIELPKTPSAASEPFSDLVRAVVARQHAGVEVKIIMSEYETAGYLEQLQAAGLDVVNVVKIQNNVHNKGIVVDGFTVLVSSQNWSTAGTLENRDAGVIIECPEVAAYFEQIFLHDWNHLALQKAATD
jgi:phosphatidylserine/phosphatidylglycerophosphate/cardiolipin synthase-like enzyme